MGEQAGAELTEERASWEDESGLTAGDAMVPGPGKGGKSGTAPNPQGFQGSHLENRASA